MNPEDYDTEGFQLWRSKFTCNDWMIRGADYGKYRETFIVHDMMRCSKLFNEKKTYEVGKPLSFECWLMEKVFMELNAEKQTDAASEL